MINISGKVYRDIVDTIIMKMEFMRGRGDSPLQPFLQGQADDFSPMCVEFLTLEGRRGVFTFELHGRMTANKVGIQMRDRFPITLGIRMYPAVSVTDSKNIIYADEVETPDYAYPEVVDELMRHMALGYFLKGYVSATNEAGRWVEIVLVLSMLKLNLVIQHTLFVPNVHDPATTGQRINEIVEAINRQLVIGFSDGILARAIRERLHIEVIPSILGRIGDIFTPKTIPDFSPERLTKDLKRNINSRPDWPFVFLGHIGKNGKPGEVVKPITGVRQRIIEVG